MSLRKTVLTSVAFAATFGLSVASSAIALPQPTPETLLSQTNSGTETRTPARIVRLVQNEELAEVELLTTGETLLIDLTGVQDRRELEQGDYVVITTPDGVVANDNVSDIEEVTEVEATDLLAEIDNDSTTTADTTDSTTSGTSSTTGSASSSTTRTSTTTTTVQSQQPARPAPAPAARPAPAPTQPVRALW